MQKISDRGGMSLTTGFDVQFDFKKPNRPFADVFYKDKVKDVVEMFCDEAQLPNVQSAVGQINGRYLGEGSVSYPHTRIFTDVGLGFLLDANLTALKFFTAWYDFIYSEKMEGYNGRMEEARGALKPEPETRANRMQFMDDYTCTCRIIKSETGKNRSNERAPITYLLENFYPYSVEAVPLSYGTSQIARVNVSFYYSRHTVRYGNVKGGYDPMENTPGQGWDPEAKINRERWTPPAWLSQQLEDYAHEKFLDEGGHKFRHANSRSLESSAIPGDYDYKGDNIQGEVNGIIIPKA